MARIQWDNVGERLFETGVEKGVLYTPDENGAFVDGVPWNGLTSIKEARSEAGSTPYYIDGVKYIDLVAPSDYKAVMEAYTYPDEFLPFDGVADVGNGLFLDNQVPKTFGLSYRTRIGNDVDGADHAYKLHILYNVTATPTDKSYASIGDRVSPMSFSWNIVAGAPQILPGFRPSAHLIFDSRGINYHLLGDIEDLLYGSETEQPHLPPIDVYLDLIANWKVWTVVDNGDGTWTATSKYGNILDVNANGRFEIREINTEWIGPHAYKISNTP